MTGEYKNISNLFDLVEQVLAGVRLRAGRDVFLHLVHQLVNPVWLVRQLLVHFLDKRDRASVNGATQFPSRIPILCTYIHTLHCWMWPLTSMTSSLSPTSLQAAERVCESVCRWRWREFVSVSLSLSSRSFVDSCNKRPHSEKQNTPGTPNFKCSTYVHNS